MQTWTCCDGFFLAALVFFVTCFLVYSTKYVKEKEFFTMNRVFQQVYTLGPTLAASHVFTFAVPFDCQLIHVSLSNSSANVGTLKIGKTGDDDAYLLAENFGASAAAAEVATPAGFDGADAGGQYPHILDGTTVLVTITDHASHMANVCVVLTFTEG